jgi:hypothetical protein
MANNFMRWQKNKVQGRAELIADVLNSMRAHKSSVKSVTELARVVCQTITAVERARAKDSLSTYKAINSATLLRIGGNYRSLLDSYLVDLKLRTGELVDVVTDPVAQRVILSKEVEISNLNKKLSRALKDKAGRHDAQSRVVTQVTTDTVSNFDAMGEVAELFFDALIRTELFKLDESTGEILLVSRARRVVFSRHEIAHFLNWRNSKYSGGVCTGE